MESEWKKMVAKLEVESQRVKDLEEVIASTRKEEKQELF
jgi:hypothetical protein